MEKRKHFIFVTEYDESNQFNDGYGRYIGIYSSDTNTAMGAFKQLLNSDPDILYTNINRISCFEIAGADSNKVTVFSLENIRKKIFYKT